jgi:2-octaprenyl-6-methoxyphenol hydroxylase
MEIIFMNENYDLIISGAGLVGASLALALQNAPFKIAVLETHLPETLSPHTLTRPLSLSYGSQKILETLGIWQELSDHAQVITQVHVSEEKRLGALHFRAKEENVPALGYVVPANLLQKILYQRAAQISPVQFISMQKIIDVQQQEQGVSIKLQTIQGEKKLKTELLVVAEGTHSTTRELLGMQIQEQTNDWLALTATIEISQNHQSIAYERFIQQGVVAVLPLKNVYHCRVVWVLPQSFAQTTLDWSERQFIEFFQKTLPDCLGSWRILDRSRPFPLPKLKAKEQIRAGVVLLGNSAHTLYPLAAQGFNLGLRDAAALAELLINARQQQHNLGDKQVLQSYLDWRMNDQRWIRGLTNGASQLFDLQIPGLGLLRGIGLLAADLTPLLKHKLAKRLMGLSGKLPKLARGVAI